MDHSKITDQVLLSFFFLLRLTSRESRWAKSGRRIRCGRCRWIRCRCPYIAEDAARRIGNRALITWTRNLHAVRTDRKVRLSLYTSTRAAFKDAPTQYMQETKPEIEAAIRTAIKNIVRIIPFAFNFDCVFMYTIKHLVFFYIPACATDPRSADVVPDTYALMHADIHLTFRIGSIAIIH